MVRILRQQIRQQHDPLAQRRQIHELLPGVHPSSHRPQAVEDGDAAGLGEEVGEGDAAAVGLDLQAPAAVGGKLYSTPGEGGVL